MDANLFADLPFNLAGEAQSSELTAEAEARVRALAESEARKAQTFFKWAENSFSDYAPGSGNYNDVMFG